MSRERPLKCTSVFVLQVVAVSCRCVAPVRGRQSWQCARVRSERVPRSLRLRAAVRRPVVLQAPPPALNLKRDWLLVAGQDTEGLSLLQVSQIPTVNLNNKTNVVTGKIFLYCTNHIFYHPKPTPNRKLSAFLLSQKNSLCMIYKLFEIWEHGVKSS